MAEGKCRVAWMLSTYIIRVLLQELSATLGGSAARDLVANLLKSVDSCRVETCQHSCATETNACDDRTGSRTYRPS